jgi:PAS domain S-box-containing protein
MGRVYNCAFVRDISERRRSEERLHLQTSALEAAANGIVITDRRGIILWVNRAFTTLTGYGLEEAVGRDMRITASGRQDDAFYKHLWETVLAGSIWHGELVNRRKNGTVYTEDMTITPLRSSGGEITHFIAIKQDVTAKKELEAQLVQAQRLETLGRLAGGVSHDFNNLLQIINGNCKILLKRLDDGNPLRENVQDIRSAGERGASLTHQLLAFSRRQILRPQVLDLNALIAELQKMLHRLIGEDIELETRLDPGLGPLRADRSQLDQVIMNLVVNARDAMPHGGRLSIVSGNVEVCANTPIAASGLAPGAYVFMQISDTGTGMDEETQERLFEPFFTRKPQGKGTGLGLCTVYGIVKQSDGHITVKSKLGEGSVFTIYLPRLTKETGDKRAAEVVRPPVGGTETILLVEDEEKVRKLLAEILHTGGYRVLPASGVEEALELCEGHRGPIQLLITDMIMPRMNGLELSRRFAALRPSARMLFMTGYTGENPLPAMIVPSAFLQKPFEPEALLHKVRETLDAAELPHPILEEARPDVKA